MTPQERIKDIFKTGYFNKNEIVQEQKSHIENYFTSIEYYLIIHLTDAELYYTDQETLDCYDAADLIEDTKKGRIYCYS